MNVLFVSQTLDSRTPYRDESTRYRCYHMAEGLHAAGVFADVTTLASTNLVNLSRYDVVSIQQPSASPKLLAILQRCRHLNIRTVADIDALEFDPALAEFSEQCRHDENKVDSARLKFLRQSLALKHFDEVSVATSSLARRRRTLAPDQPVYVVPNALSMHWLNSIDNIEIRMPQRQRLGYFPSNGRECINFAQAARSIAHFLKCSPKRELFTTGSSLFSGHHVSATQLITDHWLAFDKLPSALSSCWANLVPHQNNDMGFAQPHTKFIEAAAFGVPTIGSCSDDLLCHDVPGLLIAKTGNDWLQCLETLCDENYHQKCRKALYDYARDCCMASHSAAVLIRQWNATHKSSKNETATNLPAAS